MMMPNFGLIIFILFNQLIEMSIANKSIRLNYFDTICQFLKYPDVCKDGYRSSLLKMKFNFGLALEEECGFKNESIKDVYFYKEDNRNIFIYSLIEANLNALEKTDYNSTIYATSLPLTELISQFNNGNVPSIFIYLPVPNVTSDELILDIKFDDDFEYKLFKENQTISTVLEDNKAISSNNCSHLNERDFFLQEQLIPSVNRPYSKSVKLKDQNFHTYLQFPKDLKDRLADSSFIIDQNRMNKSLFLKLKFELEGLSNIKIDRLLAASTATIVLNYCSKIREDNFITYGCEVVSNLDNLQCFCIEFPVHCYFSYVRFVSIITMIIIFVYLTRIFSDLVKHMQKLLLFEKTKQDRILHILCSNRTALFDYILTFEIGCATPSFDFENTCIDFELQTPDSRAMTQGRILGKILSKEKINCIEFRIKRLTQLNRDMLDSIIIQHNCSNSKAKIFLYDLNLKQVTEQTKFIFSINDYIRSYKQKYILTINTFANISSIRSVSDKINYDSVKFKEIESLSNGSNLPQVKSCEIFPHKRIYVQPYPSLNEFEINLILIFSSFFAFKTIIWLIQHKHCVKRTFGCYFNIFKVSFILTSSVYLVIFLVYRFLFKHQQMKAIYLKRSTIWLYGVQFLNLTLILASFFVIREIIILDITIYVFEFYACSLSLMFTIPLLMLCVDLTNIIIENSTLKRSLNFNSIQPKLGAKSMDKADLKSSLKTSDDAKLDNLTFKSTEFKPSIDNSLDSVAFENNKNKTEFPDLDNYYSEIKKRMKRSRRNHSDSSLKELQNFQIKDNNLND